MSVSNLTNTTWVFNNSLTINSSATYALIFSSDIVEDLGELNIKLSTNKMEYFIDDPYGSYKTVYQNGTWDNDGYKTIHITGGTDVTNATLIAWLEANATQQVETNPLVETTISVGTKQLYNAYLGQGALQKIYKGTSLIFNRLEANFETSDHNLLITSNGDIFNVQDAPTPSGFNVTMENRVENTETGKCFYSLDGGVTWVDLSNTPTTTIQLTGITQIMFKVDGSIANCGRFISSTLNLDLYVVDGPNISQNYVLTQNVTDIITYVYYD